MRKHLLLGLTVGIGLSASAQNAVKKAPVPILSVTANQAAFKSLNHAVDADIPFSNVHHTSVASRNAVPFVTPQAISETIIGNTGYDLGSNSSVRNTFVRNADGTMSAVWTISTQTSGWTDRGTGYNYFNGTTWGAIPTSRIEATRTGWGNIGVTGTGAEIGVSHNTASSALEVFKRATKGTGTWIEDLSSIPGATPEGNWWPRLAIGGLNDNTVHVISITYPTASGGSMYQGLDGAVTYCRSQDGGATWDVNHMVIPGSDSSNYTGFGGDSYAIAAKGNNVAIIAGDETNDLILLKSTDNGTTWTKTMVDSFPIQKWDPATTISDINGDAVADTIDTHDGCYAITIDNNGKAHVFFGAMRILQETPQAGYSYFPGTDGLLYWDETMPANSPVMVAAAMDINGNGTLDVTDWGTYYNSLTSFPNAAYDQSGKLVLSYSSIVEGTDDGGGKSYRHVYVTRSDDNGATWPYTPVDVTVDPQAEGVYADLADDLDNNVHLIYQRDYNPGYGVPPSSGTPPDPNNQGTTAEIVYVTLPVSDLALGINEETASINNYSVFPNPASDNLTVSFDVNNSEVAVVNVYNMMGQQVSTFSNTLMAGKNSLTINVSNYTPGVYFVNTTFGGNVYAQKVVIK